MKQMSRIVFVLLLLCAGNLLWGHQAQAATSCHQINAKGTGQDLGGGVTVAQITGGGLLQGTMVGNFVPIRVSPPVVTLAGTVQFTTHQATLTVSVIGSFDLATGQFSANGPVTAATGKLTGVIGDLVFSDVEKLTDGSFVETVTGMICVDLAS